MTLRLVHPAQQGSRISWLDSLFQQVDRVEFADTVPAEQVPQPEVSELTWPELDALDAAELLTQSRAR